MNPDVKGAHKVSSIDNFIADVNNFGGCSLVIANDVTQGQAKTLSEMMDKLSIPMCILRQYGMLGYLRLFKRKSLIIETKDKENPFKRDLRCATPWPELLEYANSFNFDTLSENEQIHVPYAVILIQAANKWRQEHEGNLPKTFAEKGEFK